MLHYAASARASVVQAAFHHENDRFHLARTSEYSPGAPVLLFGGDAWICPTTGTAWTPVYESFPGELGASAQNLRTPPEGYIAVSELLSARRDSAFVDSRDINRATPLHFATVVSDCGGVRTLLEHGADQFAATAQGATPLDLAANRVVRNTLVPVDSAVQIAVGLRVQRPGMRAAPLGASAGQNVLMRTCGAGGADGGDRDGASTVAAKRSAAENALVALVNAGEDINAKTGIKLQAPLHLAAERGAVDVVQLLLSNGAIVDVTDVDGRTPLHYAAEQGSVAHAAVAQLLFASGADVNATSSLRKTPLHMAATGGPRFLAGVALIPPPSTSTTHISSSSSTTQGGTGDGNAAMLTLLAELGANLEARDLEGDTPLIAAAQRGNHLGVQTLLIIGSVIYATNIRGQTALHGAAFHGALPCVRQLVRWDAEIGKLKFTLDSSGRSAYDVAADGSVREALHTLWEAAASTRLDLAQAVQRQAVLLPPDAQAPWLPVRVWEATRVLRRTPLHAVVTGAAKSMAVMRAELKAAGISGGGAAAAAAKMSGGNKIAMALSKAVKQRHERESHVDTGKGTGLPAHKISPSAVHIIAGLGHRWVQGGRLPRDVAAGGRLVDASYRDWSGDFADVDLCFPVIRDPLHQIQTIDGCAFVPRPRAYRDLIPTALLGDTSRSEAAAARVVPGNELTSCTTEKDAGRVVDFLIKVGVDLDGADIDGVTPLMLACKYGLLFIMRRLLKSGAQTNIQDGCGNTAMHYATAFVQPAAADIIAEFSRLGESGLESSLDSVTNTLGLKPIDVRGWGPSITPDSHEKKLVVAHLPKKSLSLRVTQAL